MESLRVQLQQQVTETNTKPEIDKISRIARNRLFVGRFKPDINGQTASPTHLLAHSPTPRPRPALLDTPLQATLACERVSALLEDRRLRMAEEAARRATEAQHAQAVEEALTRSEALLVVRCCFIWGFGMMSLGGWGLFCAEEALTSVARSGWRFCF
jgi:hypothetical protein